MRPLAPDFVAAADRFGIDWRLLPSIAMVESSGGKHYKNRNVFGWGSGKIEFPSIRSSIHYLAWRLARSPVYAGKDLPDLLRAYNPGRPEYPERVLRFLRLLPEQGAEVRLPIETAGRITAGGTTVRGGQAGGPNPIALPSRRRAKTLRAALYCGIPSHVIPDPVPAVRPAQRL